MSAHAQGHSQIVLPAGYIMTTGSAVWVDAPGSWLWQPDKYTNVIAAYFEVILRDTSGSGLGAYAQLYDVGAGAAVPGTELSTTSSDWQRLRTPDIFPFSLVETELIVQLQCGGPPSDADMLCGHLVLDIEN